ncbi:MAG TPA: cytochrome c [Pyrinomonadaceae bacterium]|jgi:mono/diheme cytochrome c family protein|nr:cytochrome c [Pyrinomonadaceae bacterium]
MLIKTIKLVAVAIFIFPILAVSAFRPTYVGAATVTDDAATIFKTKCAMCHGQKAEKFYDPAIPDADQVTAILKGKKGEKPPYMPAFETKGITEDDAKALAAFMKSLKTAN